MKKKTLQWIGLARKQQKDLWNYVEQDAMDKEIEWDNLNPENQCMYTRCKLLVIGNVIHVTNGKLKHQWICNSCKIFQAMRRLAAEMEYILMGCQMDDAQKLSSIKNQDMPISVVNWTKIIYYMKALQEENGISDKTKEAQRLGANGTGVQLITEGLVNKDSQVSKGQ